MRRFTMTLGGTLVVLSSSLIASGQDKGPGQAPDKQAPAAVQAPVEKQAPAAVQAPAEKQAPAPVQAPATPEKQAPAPVQAPTQKISPVQSPSQAPVQKHAAVQCQSPVQKGDAPLPPKQARVGLFNRYR